MKDSTFLFLCLYCLAMGFAIQFKQYHIAFVMLAPILRIMKEKQLP